MNILIINHYAGSIIHGMEYRPFYLAREWVKLGHNVTIIAASFSHLRSKEPKTNGSITIEDVDGIQYIWLKTPRYEGNSIGRVINMMVFSLMLIVHKSRIIRDRKPDLVIASSPHPFIIFGAHYLSSSSSAMLVFEVRDLWPLTLIKLGNISPLHPLVILMKWVEKYAYRISDYVISLLPKADFYMMEHGMAAHKFIYVPNGVDVVEWLKSDTFISQYHFEVLSKLREEKNFVVGYAGAHNLSNALDTLIDAAYLLQSEQVRIVLVGQGNEKKTLERKVSHLGLKNVIFLPPVPKATIPSLLNLMDVLFIGWLRSPLYRFGVSPNKLLDYMMSAKPIIHAAEAANDLVAESGCGITVPPEDPKALADAIIRLLNMTTAERTAMGLKGKDYVMSNHDYIVLAKRFLESFDDK